MIKAMKHGSIFENLPCEGSSFHDQKEESKDLDDGYVDKNLKSVRSTKIQKFGTTGVTVAWDDAIYIGADGRLTYSDTGVICDGFAMKIKILNQTFLGTISGLFEVGKQELKKMADQLKNGMKINQIKDEYQSQVDTEWENSTNESRKTDKKFSVYLGLSGFEEGKPVTVTMGVLRKIDSHGLATRVLPTQFNKDLHSNRLGGIRGVNAIGSGARIALKALDKALDTMTGEELNSHDSRINLLRYCVACASLFDPGTGGNISVASITCNGEATIYKEKSHIITEMSRMYEKLSRNFDKCMIFEMGGMEVRGTIDEKKLRDYLLKEFTELVNAFVIGIYNENDYEKEQEKRNDKEKKNWIVRILKFKNHEEREIAYKRCKDKPALLYPSYERSFLLESNSEDEEAEKNIDIIVRRATKMDFEELSELYNTEHES